MQQTPEAEPATPAEAIAEAQQNPGSPILTYNEIKDALGDEAITVLRCVWQTQPRWYGVVVQEIDARVMKIGLEKASFVAIYWQEPKTCLPVPNQTHGECVPDVSYKTKRKWTSRELCETPVLEWVVPKKIKTAFSRVVPKKQRPRMKRLASELEKVNGFLQHPNQSRGKANDSLLVAHDPIPSETGRGHFVILMGTKDDITRSPTYQKTRNMRYHSCRVQPLCTPTEFVVHVANLLIDQHYKLNGVNSRLMLELVMQAVRKIVNHQKERRFSSADMQLWRKRLIENFLQAFPPVDDKNEAWRIHDADAVFEDDSSSDEDQYPR